MSKALTYFPSINDLARGAETTLLLLRLKWRTTRKIKSKIFLWAGFIILSLAVFLSAQVGTLIREVAQNGDPESAAQQFALVYLATFTRGELGTFGAAALGLSLLSAVVAPFTGAIRTSIMSTRDTVAFPLTRWYRFTDSIAAQVFSSIAILQLVALSAISSLLTLQGGRGMSMLFTWTVWLALVAVSTLSIWAAESLYRKFGFKVRMIVLGTVAIVVGLLVLLDPEHGKTLFGLGTVYADIVQTIGTTMSGAEVARAFAIVIGSTLLIFFSGAFLSSVALSLPERDSESKKQRKVFRVHKPFKIPELEIIYFFITSILRATESRKPVIAAVGLGATFVIVTNGEYTIASTFTVMIPLVAALAWGANVFGTLGGGTVWLASQPRIFNRLPWLFFVTQSLVTFVLFALVWLPGALLGRVDLTMLPSIAMAATAVTALVARSSIHKTIHNPYPTRFGARGETLLPPVTTLNYTFRFALWAGQYGVLLLSINNAMIQLALTFLAVAWSALRMTRLQEKWNSKPEIRQEVMSKVVQE